MISTSKTQTRHSETLPGPWYFCIDPDDIGEEDRWFARKHDISRWTNVAVPSAWNFYSPALWGYEGVGWYVTDLTWEESQLGQRLSFGRAAWQARVWLNGQYIGEHLGGDLPFEFDLTGRLDPDRPNRLAVRLDNAPRLEWLPGSLVIERMTYGGLLSPVVLRTTGTVMVEELRVHALPVDTSALVHIEGSVQHPGNDPLEARLEISVLVGNQLVQREMPLTLAPGQTKWVMPDLHMPGAQAWSPDSPVLYTLQARLSDAHGTLLDIVNTRFGVRSIQTRWQEILLNGKPIYLRGANLYPEYPDVGPCASLETLRRELETMKRSGINFVRLVNPQDIRILDLLDELGLMCDEEVYLNWWGVHFWPATHVAEENADTVIPEAESNLAEMVKRDWNHPCIIAWGMANESATYEPVGIEAMRRMMALARQLDPTRLLTFIAAGDGCPHLAFDEADLVCVNLYMGVFDDPPARHLPDIEVRTTQPTLEILRAQVERFPNKPILVSEFGCHGIEGMHGDTRYCEEFQAAYIEAVWSAIRSVPGVQGGVIWCWSDYQHRRNFINNGWSSPFGPFGVVGYHRQKKAAWKALCRMYGGQTE